MKALPPSAGPERRLASPPYPIVRRICGLGDGGRPEAEFATNARRPQAPSLANTDV